MPTASAHTRHLLLLEQQQSSGGRENLHDGRAAPLLGEAKGIGVTPRASPSLKLLAAPGGLGARCPHQSTAALLWALRAPVRVRADTLKFTVSGNIAAADLTLGPTGNPEAGASAFPLPTQSGRLRGRRHLVPQDPRFHRPWISLTLFRRSRFRLLQVPPPMRVPPPSGSASFRVRLLQVPQP